MKSEKLSSADIQFVTPSDDKLETGETPPTEELTEDEAQAKLLEILSQPPLPDQKVKTIVCRSTVTEHTASYESNFAEYRIIEPLLRGRILELFCGYNTAKRYMQKHNIPGETIGVDIDDEHADIHHDVAKLPDVLPPQGQFDLVTNFGGTPGFENFHDNYYYLKDDGLYISGMSGDWYEGEAEKSIASWINGQNQEITNNEVKKASQYFQPVVIVRVIGIHNVINWDESERKEFDGNMVMIISRKKKLGNP